MALSPGQRLTKALLADNNRNLHRNAVIPLTGKITVLPAPLPLLWPLPNPCAVPAKSDGSVGFEVPGGGAPKLEESNWNTASASSTCVFNPNTPPFPTIYDGYVPPPEASGKVLKIPGWPGAKMVVSTLPHSNPGYFVQVTFKRQFHGRTVWGQTWLPGAFCTAARPSDASTAKALYDEFGSRPSVSVPKLRNNCN